MMVMSLSVLRVTDRGSYILLIVYRLRVRLGVLGLCVGEDWHLEQHINMACFSLDSFSLAPKPLVALFITVVVLAHTSFPSYRSRWLWGTKASGW